MSPDAQTITVSWNIIWGILLAGLAFHWRRLARDNWANWNRANQPTQKSFENTASAMEGVRLGCLGLILGSGYWILWVLSLALALDLVFADGELILWRSGEIAQWITEVMATFSQFAFKLLRALLSE